MSAKNGSRSRKGQNSSAAPEFVSRVDSKADGSLPTEQEIRESQETSVAINSASAATVAAVIDATPAAPAQKRGKSSIQTPVAYVWVTCHNMFAQAQKSGSPAPSRKSLVAANIDAGIAYYTARTQVQAYLKETKNGTVLPKKLPRNVSLTPIA